MSQAVAPAPQPSAPGPEIDLCAEARAVIRAEAEALARLEAAIGPHFAEAAALIRDTLGRVVVTGMGKSGHIARKCAATLCATATPALFLHPAEAAHGDLGSIGPGDCLVMLSHSGATRELLPIIDHARAIGCAVVAMTANAASPLARAAHVALILPLVREACPAALAPTASSAMMLALGDALAIAVMRARGVRAETLQRLHPAGAIGLALAPVERIMHRGAALPLVPQTMAMPDVLVEMTAKRLGIAGVVDDEGALVGAITDGDLRRHIAGLMHADARAVMTPAPHVVPLGTSAGAARAAMARLRITALFVVDPADPRRALGLVHIHDLGVLPA